MRKVKNVTFVTNLQQGACLLFERKRKPVAQAQKISHWSLRNFFNRLHDLHGRTNVAKA